MEQSIEKYWGAIRGGRAKHLGFSLVQSRALTPLLVWGSNLESSSTMMVLPGEDREACLSLLERELPSRVIVRSRASLSSTSTRTRLLESTCDLKVPAKFRTNFDFQPPEPEGNPLGWDLIWSLIATANLSLSSNLVDLTSNRSSRFMEFYRAILEARFEAREGQSIASIEDNVMSIVYWIEGNTYFEGSARAFYSKAGIKSKVQPGEQLDLLMFILTLARDNHLLDDFIAVLEGFEGFQSSTLDEVSEVIEAACQWSTFGCPLHLLVEWRLSTEEVSRLMAHHPKLHDHIVAGMGWMRGESS